MVIFVSGNSWSISTTGTVDQRGRVDTWSDRFTLSLNIGSKKVAAPPVPGQFFMLRKKGSKNVLARPFSLYRYLERFGEMYLDFIIAKKGNGTEELSELEQGEKVDIMGPLGNGFPLPDANDRVCIVGGGVGVAPVVNLATRLPEDSYDFYACFKYSSFGLWDLPKRPFRVATESGLEGTKGTLEAILDVNILKERGYTIVYACGPTPMLKYVQTICKEANVKSYFSMESRMACGVGACLGCTVKTIEGNKRCCKDGPVFLGESVIFEDEIPKVLQGENEGPIDLSVRIAGVRFTNPVIASSGTFGYGVEYKNYINLGLLGGICSKGLTLEPRAGNDGVRVYEVSGVGMMNSIGLENPGIKHFIDNELAPMLATGAVVIANLSGSSVEDYVAGAKLLDGSKVDMIELNISCPNVKAGGMSFGMMPEAAEEVTRAVKEVTGKPLMVKLTPNAPDLVGVALAVKAAGADAISLVNTFQALAVDIETGKPVFNNTYAGYSGPGIKPIALRMVHEVAKAVCRDDPDYAVVGLGGITTWQDAVEYIMAGATAVQIGTATFANPKAMIEIISGIDGYMRQKKFRTVEEFRGILV